MHATVARLIETGTHDLVPTAEHIAGPIKGTGTSNCCGAQHYLKGTCRGYKNKKGREITFVSKRGRPELWGEKKVT